MTTAEDFARSGQRLAAAYRRMIDTPQMQALIRADYERRMAELPWWRFKARRELQQKYRMLRA